MSFPAPARPPGRKQIELSVDPTGHIFARLNLQEREHLAQTSRFWRDARAATSPDSDALLCQAIERRLAVNPSSALSDILAGLAKLPAAAPRLQQVRTLKLPRLRLSADDLAALAAACPHLEHLDVQDNQIERLPTALWGLRELKHLQLRLNAVKSVDHELVQLQALTHLNLNGSPVEQLPDVFDRLPNLRCLALLNHRLTQLPPTLERAAAHQLTLITERGRVR